MPNDASLCTDSTLFWNWHCASTKSVRIVVSDGSAA
jgi:hypothetical protein